MKKQITSIAVHITLMCIFIGMNRFHALAQERPDSVLVNSIGGFTKNMGQLLNTEREAAEGVLYYSGAGGINYYLLENRVAFVFNQGINQEDEDSLYRVDMTFDFCNERPDTVYEGNQMFYKNFYLAHTGSGIDSVSVLDSVTYQNLVSGFNISYKMVNGLMLQIEMDNEASMDNLYLYFEDADSIFNADIAGGGYLAIYTPGGTITFDSLFAYQIIGNTVVPIGCNVTVGELAFRIKADPARPDQNIFIVLGNKASTIIPWVPSLPSGPSMVNYFTNFFQTDPAGLSLNMANDVFRDSDGYLYVAGTAMGISFPAQTGQFPYSPGNGMDAFVSKLNNQLTLLWSSFFGGSSLDFGTKVVANSEGYIYLAGTTTSNDLPICTSCSPADPRLEEDNFQGGDYDVFLAKFDPLGKIQNTTLTGVVFSTYIGGAGNEIIASMCIDDNDNVYVGGSVDMDSYGSFPEEQLTNAYKQSSNSNDDGFLNGFIMEINANDEIIWSTGIGGQGNEIVTALTIDHNGQLIALGTTGSEEPSSIPSIPITSNTASYFPLVDPGGSAFFRPHYGSIGQLDFFVSKFNSVKEIEWSTIFGGTSVESGFLFDISALSNFSHSGIDVTSNGNIVITGFTFSSSYNGGNYPGFPQAVISNSSGYYNQASAGGGGDAFFAMFDDGFELLWSTFAGGSVTDYPSSVVCSEYDGYIYFLGKAGSDDINNLILIPGNYFGISTHAPGNINAPDAYDGFLFGFYENGIQNYGTYFSGSLASYEECSGMAIDAVGSQLFFCGSSSSAGMNFPLANPGPPAMPVFSPSAGGNNTPFLTNFKFFCDPCLRMADEANEQTVPLHVFPNPASTYISVNLSSKSVVRIYNRLGQSMLSSTIQENQLINIKSLTDGLYILQAEDERRNHYSTKFIIQK